MKPLALGCALGLAGWLAVAAGISWYLQWRYGYASGATIGVSALAGLSGWAALGLFNASLRSWRERSAVAGGIAGVRPSDGPRAVLVGRIHPIGMPLHAPLDGAACVCYAYDVTQETGTGRRRTILTHFKGVGLTPSVVLTPSGSYRLLAVPDLEEADGAAGSSADHVAAFGRYARATSFTGRETSAQELIDRWTDADGSYHSDVAYASLETVNLVNCRLVQRYIRPGAAVAVFGRFSAEKGGIVPTTGVGGNPRLVQGDVPRLVGVLGATARTRLILGALATAASIGLVAAFINGQ